LSEVRLGVRCAYNGCTAEATLNCEVCAFSFCRRHNQMHSHGGSKGSGAGIG